MEKEIVIDGKTLHVVTGKMLREWNDKYAHNRDLWSIDVSDFIDGTMDVNEEIWYWLIEGRCYETDVYVN